MEEAIEEEHINYEDPNLLVHGQQWFVCGDRTDDTPHLYNKMPLINYPSWCHQKVDKSPIDYFKTVFPMRILDSILTNENKFLLENKWRVTSRSELWKLIGIRGAIMLDPVRGGYPEYWKSSIEVPSITMPRNFEARFGMSYNRFRQLMYCFKMAWSPTRARKKAVLLTILCVG